MAARRSSAISPRRAIDTYANCLHWKTGPPACVCSGAQFSLWELVHQVGAAAHLGCPIGRNVLSVKTASFGSWASPITADLISSQPVRLGDVAVEGNAVYGTESRPRERGRIAVARHSPEGGIEDVVAAPFNARTLVHEYGGGALLVHDGTPMNFSASSISCTFSSTHRDKVHSVQHV